MSYRAKINDLNSIKEKYFPKGFKATILHNKPYIVKLRRFLNTKEIEALMSLGEGKFNRSTIILNDEMTRSTTRTSHTAFITDDGHRKKYSPAIDDVLKKVCYLVGCERNKIESLMIVRYNENQEYYNHHDYFETDFTEMIQDGGQRVATFFCYLNSLDEEDGGETEFPLIRLKSKPSKGTAVFWWDTKKDGTVIPKTLHRGNPVKGKGIVKYGLNIWVRKKGW